MDDLFCFAMVICLRAEECNETQNSFHGKHFLPVLDAAAVLLQTFFCVFFLFNLFIQVYNLNTVVCSPIVHLFR